MSRDRSVRGRMGKKRQSRVPAHTAGREGIRLAPGTRLAGGEKQGAVSVLVCPSGKVQLNGSADAILRLCDGSRRREDIVKELTARSKGHTLATDIVAFLDAARARGWIIES